MEKQKVNAYGLTFEPVGNARLEKVRNLFGTQISVITQGSRNGLKTQIPNLQYVDFVVPATEDVFHGGIETRLGIPGKLKGKPERVILRSTYKERMQGQEELKEIFLDLAALSKASIQTVYLDTYNDTEHTGSQTISLPTDRLVVEETGDLVALAAEPPDTFYYYRDGSGNWVIGYDWSESTSIQLVYPGSEEEVQTPIKANFLSMGIQVTPDAENDTVDFELCTMAKMEAMFSVAFSRFLPVFPGTQRQTSASLQKADAVYG